MADGEDISQLYDRPGYLLRRALQKATAVFAENCKDVTTTQMGALFILARREGLDQKELAELLHIDQTNMGVVIKSLEKNGFLKRRVSGDDKRRKILLLTDSGRLAFRAIEQDAELAQQQLVSNLTTDEQREFVRLLKKL